MRVALVTAGLAVPALGAWAAADAGRLRAASMPWGLHGLRKPGLLPGNPVRGATDQGAPGRTYNVVIRANAIHSDGVFCKGRARLQISTELVFHDSVDGPKRHNLRTLWFRVR